MKNSFVQFIKQYQLVAALLFLLFGWFLLLIKEVLIALFIAYIIMAALHPMVDILRAARIPKGVAVALTYLLAIAVLVVLVLPLVPFFAVQISRLIAGFPGLIDSAARTLNVEINQEQLNTFFTSEIGRIGQNAYVFTTWLFGGVFSLLTTLVISFYLLLDRERIVRGITSFFPKHEQERAKDTIRMAEDKLGAWLRGQVILSVSIGVLTYVTLTIIGLEYALPLAVLAGLLEIVPTIGPIIAAIPAIIVALTVSGGTALIVGAAYAIIQILENNLLVPRIMQRAVGLNPIIVIVGIIAGGKLLGLVGALLSVPFITLLIVLYHAIRNNQS